MSLILATGGTGRLGTAITSILHEQTRGTSFEWLPLGSKDIDITDLDSVETVISHHRPKVALHLAAYTDVAKAGDDRQTCWDLNVVGTRNVAAIAAKQGARVVHISTDYVFWGGSDRPPNGYRETDPVGPVRNYYALTKLVAEEAAQRDPNNVIVRTSFRPSEWPYPSAFSDLYTSQDYVDVIAKEIILLLTNLNQVKEPCLHIGTERKSVYDLVKRRNPEVKAGSRMDIDVNLPHDISLDSSLWNHVRASFQPAY